MQIFRMTCKFSGLTRSLGNRLLFSRCHLRLHAGIFGTPVMWKKQCYVIIYAKKSSLWSRAASNISRAHRKPTQTDAIANRISCARWENYTCVLFSIPLLQPTVIRHFAAGFAYTHFHSVFILCVAALGLLLGGATTAVVVLCVAFIYLYITTSAVAERQQQQPPSRSHTNVRSHTLYNMRGALWLHVCGV